MAKFNLDIPKIGYFLVYKHSGGFFGNQIVKAQRSAGFSEEDSMFTHVEPSLGGQHSINARPPRIIPIDITDVHKGRFVKLVKPNFNNILNNEHIVEEFNRKRRYKTALWSSTRSNMPYGAMSILWFKFFKQTFKRNFFSAVGDICSEVSGYGLFREYCFANEKYLTSAILPRNMGELYPADFLDKNYFTEVWEGVIE